MGQKNEFALLFRDCETNKSTVEEIKEAGGLGRKAMSIMVMVMLVVMVMILIVSRVMVVMILMVSMVMLVVMVMILMVSMVMLAPRSCLGIPVRRESARGGGRDGKVGQC